MGFTAFLETRLNPSTRSIGDIEGWGGTGSSGGSRGGIGDISRDMS
jgi:hypothetical protein